MKPETSEFMAYAGKLMADARHMLESGLADHAARTAYLACFHAARAYAFERTESVARTHRGVQTEFLRLSREDGRIAPHVRVFLSQAYEYKASVDYGTAPDETVSHGEARDALEAAGQFLAELVAALEPVSDAGG